MVVSFLGVLQVAVFFLSGVFFLQIFPVTVAAQIDFTRWELSPKSEYLEAILQAREIKRLIF